MSVNWTKRKSSRNLRTKALAAAGCLLVFLLPVTVVLSAPESDFELGRDDFYRRDEKLWAEFRDKRRIFVSAKDDSTRTLFLGAGLVDQNVTAVWCWATQADKIKSAAPSLENFSWDTKTGAVSFDFRLLWMKHHIQGQALPRYSAEPSPSRQIRVTIASGTWVPVSGEIAFLPGGLLTPQGSKDGLRADQTWIRLSGQTGEGKTLSFPLRWALEAFMQRLAGGLREKIETDPQPVKECPGGRL